jgi:hypothetical protein
MAGSYADLSIVVDELVKKKLRLTERLANLADESQKIQIESEIRQVEAEIRESRTKVQYQVGQSLRKLDYSTHVGQFRKLFDHAQSSKRVGAVLLGGSPDYGIYWLFQRLRQNVRSSPEQPIFVDHNLRGASISQSVDSLFDRMRRKFGLKPSADRKAIVAEIRKRLGTKSVVLVFEGVERLGDNLPDFIEKCWSGLVRELEVEPLPDARTQLLGFFLHAGDASATRPR